MPIVSLLSGLDPVRYFYNTGSTSTTSTSRFAAIGDTHIVLPTTTTSAYFVGSTTGATSALRVFDGMQWVEYSGIYPTQVYNPPPPPTGAMIRKRQRDRMRQTLLARGSIKRALRLMDNVGFGDDVRVFLNGDDVEVSHPESIFKFVLSKKANSLMLFTTQSAISTPYHLNLYTKTDVYVASLCVYFEDTPILDQVLALSMFVKTGDEEHILKTANWSRINEEIKDDILNLHPYLHKKLGRVWHP